MKIETQPVALPAATAILSPGLFDPGLPARHRVFRRRVPCGWNWACPTPGTMQKGKPRPALTARINQGFLWVDLDFDGRPGGP